MNLHDENGPVSIENVLDRSNCTLFLDDMILTLKKKCRMVLDTSASAFSYMEFTSSERGYHIGFLTSEIIATVQPDLCFRVCQASDW